MTEPMASELAEESIEALARAAGLERAWVQCREEVISAAREAALRRRALPDLDPCAEPWPPMRVPDAAADGRE